MELLKDNFIELAMMAFIMVGLAVVFWKGGATNPVGTGGLDKRLGAFEGELHGIRTEIDKMEDRVEAMEARYAKASDIKRVERRLEEHAKKMDEVSSAIAGMREDIASRRSKNEATARQVDMLFEVIVKKGMD